MNDQTTATKIEPKVGQIVLYTLESDQTLKRVTNEGKTRPAIIVEVFENSNLAADSSPPMCNLQVFLDGTNDGFDGNTGGTAWKTSKHYSPTAMPGTWRYPSDVNQQMQDLATRQETSFETPELALTQTGRDRGGII